MAETIDLLIERPVAGGRMLARHEGRVVLVSGAIPGERVRARIEPSSKKVQLATVVDVIEASPDRRLAACDPACGGSAYAFITPERQRALKAEVVADAFRRIARLTLEGAVVVAASPEHGYRVRGRLHVVDGRAGLLMERSHRLCDARAVGQFTTATIDAVDRVLQTIGAARQSVASILVAENVRATERVLHIEERDGQQIDADDLAARPLIGDDVTGVTARVGQRDVLVAGHGRVTDSSPELCGDGVLSSEVRWSHSAVSFFQANRFLTGHLLRRALAGRQGSRVLDLYAGVGLFSAALASEGADVLAVEGDEASAADLVINAAAWPSLRVSQQSVEAALLVAVPGSFDTVLIDPPRTGASPEALDRIVGLGAPRIVYVSCDPPTLARDAGRLITAGYSLSSIEAFDLFPNTPHIESLAVFDN